MPDWLALWDFNDPSASEARFREAVAALPVGSGDRLEGETQIARALGLQRRFDEAHRMLDGVVEAIEASDAAAEGAETKGSEGAADAAGAPARATAPALPARVSVRYLLERGRVFNSGGDPARALPLFVEAFDRALLEREDALAVDAAHMVAIVEAPERQMTWNERALAVSQTSKDPLARRWRASLLNNMGWTRHGEGAFDAALELFEQALEARREQGDVRLMRVARWCVARCLRSLNRIDDALGLQRSLARETAAANEPDGFVEEELGECLLALGRPGDAQPHFARAAELLGQDAWFVAQEGPRLERLKSLGGSGPASGSAP
jgi:tetratricopeptide (TPR) repeat protein